jgi:hypothetical protein
VTTSCHRFIYIDQWIVFSFWVNIFICQNIELSSFFFLLWAMLDTNLFLSLWNCYVFSSVVNGMLYTECCSVRSVSLSLFFALINIIQISVAHMNSIYLILTYQFFACLSGRLRPLHSSVIDRMSLTYPQSLTGVFSDVCVSLFPCFLLRYSKPWSQVPAFQAVHSNIAWR